MPSSYKILSGSSLKLLALFSMLVDHCAAFLLKNFGWAKEPLFSLSGHDLSTVSLMRMFGRIAFPLFAFLIVEGFIHTRDRKTYGQNLLIFALLSEIPYNLAVSGSIFCTKQNVMFTLLIGFLGLCAIEKFRTDIKNLSISLLGLMVASYLFKADYGCFGYGFIILLYLLREQKLLQAVVGCCVLPSHLVGGLAFIPINLYNGERGFIKGVVGKYLCYAFYPVHLLVLYLVRLAIC